MNTIMKELKQSETRVIKRSQINLNPINPKRHSDEKVKLQKKNLQKVGFLGGIVWNEKSGNLIDGHRRIKAMDLHYKYDGTPSTDYDVKVEVVNLDDKTEKEQLTYMAVGNTKPDIDLIAGYISDIDYTDVGLDIGELNDILSINTAIPSFSDSLDDLLSPVSSFDEIENPVMDEKTYEAKKEHMKLGENSSGGHREETGWRKERGFLIKTHYKHTRNVQNTKIYHWSNNSMGMIFRSP